MRRVIGFILIILGLACCLVAFICQQVICYQTFGAIFEQVFIPHWSAWFYLGAVPLTSGSLMIGIH